jgi:hypothetical protein
MRIDREFVIKNRFWLMLGGVGALWLPIFFVSCTGLSQGKQKADLERRESETTKLAGSAAKTQGHLDKLDKGRSDAVEYTEKVWDKEWTRQQDYDGSQWGQGTKGLFWFECMKDWSLPLAQDTRAKIEDKSNGIWAKMTAGDRTGDIDNQILKVWAKNFYEPEVKEIEPLLAPAYAKDRKDVLVCGEYEENIRDGTEETTKEEAWVLQEDLVVRREILRLLKGVSQETHRLKSVGMFHKVPYAQPSESYECADWRLELAAGDTKGSGGGSYSAASRLINIRADEKPASLANLELRFWQKQKNDQAKEMRFKLAHEGKVLHRKDITLKALGVTGGIALKGFESDRPVDISLVPRPAEGSGSGSGDTIHETVSNSNWRIDLVLEKQGNRWSISPESRLTNVQPAKRRLLVSNLELSISVNDHTPQTITLEGKPLGWGESRPFKELRIPKSVSLDDAELDKADFDHDVVIRQQAKWESNPVKRVDFIGVGYNGHMTNSVELKSHKELDVKVTGEMAVEVPAASDDVPADGSESPETYNVQFWRIEHRRYLTSTRQLRILPVAIQVVVDQAQMQEVLAALEPLNSRLNFTKTAVNWKHIPAVTPPPPEKGSGSGSKDSPPKPAGDRADTAMVELTVYGMVRLFEPFGKSSTPAASGSKK